jgi:hypothetical protein
MLTLVAAAGMLIPLTSASAADATATSTATHPKIRSTQEHTAVHAAMQAAQRAQAASTRSAQVTPNYLPPAYDEVRQWLAGSPNPDMSPTCISRSIYLAAGNYYWTQEFASSPGGHRYIYLKEGTYGWADCLVPSTGYYDHATALTPPSGATANLYHEWHTTSDGYYIWGSLLNPQF